MGDFIEKVWFYSCSCHQMAQSERVVIQRMLRQWEVNREVVNLTVHSPWNAPIFAHNIAKCGVRQRHLKFSKVASLPELVQAWGISLLPSSPVPPTPITFLICLHSVQNFCERSLAAPAGNMAKSRKLTRDAPRSPGWRDLDRPLLTRGEQPTWGT